MLTCFCTNSIITQPINSHWLARGTAKVTSSMVQTHVEGLQLLPLNVANILVVQNIYCNPTGNPLKPNVYNEMFVSYFVVVLTLAKLKVSNQTVSLYLYS